MTHFPDLATCDYFGELVSDSLLAVGWLEADREFARGSIDRNVYDRLIELLIDPWQPALSMGVHNCSICQFDGPSGNANLFIPDGEVILVCPEMIVHYIASHHYQPPQRFSDAVLNCPDVRSMDYKRLLLKSGGRKLFGASG